MEWKGKTREKSSILNAKTIQQLTSREFSAKTFFMGRSEMEWTIKLKSDLKMLSKEIYLHKIHR